MGYQKLVTVLFLYESPNREGKDTPFAHLGNHSDISTKLFANFLATVETKSNAICVALGRVLVLSK